MEQQEQLLSRLYTLRAGISAVAVEKDKADKGKKYYQDKIHDLERSIRDKDWEIKKEKSQFEDSKIAEIDKKISEAQKKLKEREDSLERYLSKDTIRWEHEDNIKFIALMIGIFILTAIVVVGIIVTVQNLAFGEISIPIVVIVGIIDIILIKYKICDGPEYTTKHRRKKRIKLRQEDILESKTCIAELEKEKAAIKADLDRIVHGKEQEKQSMQIKLDRVTENQRMDQTIRKYVQAGELLYAGLQCEFRTLLDERDWENLDYIIYMLETGRAYSLKEALQQVDAERRADRIVNAIQIASERISATFADGMRRMGALVTQCCYELSYIVSSFRQDLRFQSEQMQGIMSRVGNLTNQVSLGNALQAKANTTSLQIMQDVRTMREHSDYADWRYRNNYDS